MKTIARTLPYTGQPGTGAVFDRLVREVSVPRHRRMEPDVAACGTSLHDADASFAIRADDGHERLAWLPKAFYDSDEGTAGPRGAIVERISSGAKVVAERPSKALDARRQTERRAS